MDMEDLIRQLVPEHRFSVVSKPVGLFNIDKLRIEQVILNIVGNAAKYSKPNTSIIVNSELQGNGDLLLSIIDEGIGMSEEEIDKIFQKFYRVDDVIKKYTGFGIGLYISSKIINDHNGKIWVESVKGKGSVFFVSLPR